MSFRKFLLITLSILVPLWTAEALYAKYHLNFESQEACALIVYACIIPSSMYFISTLKSAKRSALSLYSTAAVALLTPFVVNFIGIVVAASFGGLGGEL